MRKKTTIAIVSLLACIFLWNCLTTFMLVKTADRNSTECLLTRQQKERIANETKGMDDEEIIDYSLALTSELLCFSAKNDIINGKANCVGYALLCSSITNYGLKTNGLRGNCKPVVGYIEWWGLNLCKIFNTIAPKNYKSFVKDHDFVEYRLNDSAFFYDPLLYDCLGTKAMTIEK